jgi:hypothetical protein
VLTTLVTWLTVRITGYFYDKGTFERPFKNGMLTPDEMVAEMPSMITPDNNYCILRQSQALKLFNQFSNLRINITDAGKIGML